MGRHTTHSRKGFSIKSTDIPPKNKNLLQPQASCFKSIWWSFSHPSYYQIDDGAHKTSASVKYQLLCDHSYSRNKMCEDNALPSTCLPVTN